MIEGEGIAMREVIQEQGGMIGEARLMPIERPDEPDKPKIESTIGSGRVMFTSSDKTMNMIHLAGLAIIIVLLISRK